MVHRSTKKTDKKPNVLNYHRFYVPVQIGNKVYTMRIVAEEQKDVFTFNPTAINLYDVIVEKKTIGTRTPPTNGGETSSTDSSISIRELLTNVKDYQGKPYINPDGTGNFVDVLSQGAKGSLTPMSDGKRIISLFG